MLSSELCCITTLCKSCQCPGGGPRYQVAVRSIAPPYRPSAPMILLFAIETPIPTSGGGDSGAGATLKAALMPDSLQAES